MIYVAKSELLGTIAKYAVQQSPYHRPNDLEVVLDKFNELITPAWDKAAKLDIGEFSDHVTLEAFIERFLRQIPEYLAWNERKNGNASPYQFTDRFSKENPDNDFIDLEALERNVAVEIARNQP
jgi:hypothetical protein